MDLGGGLCGFKSMVQILLRQLATVVSKGARHGRINGGPYVATGIVFRNVTKIFDVNSEFSFFSLSQHQRDDFSPCELIR